MVDRILIYDKMDGYFDAYFFKEMIDIKEIKKVVMDTKEKLEDEWTLDDIRDAICENFDVKKIILFDNTGFDGCGVIEVNEISIK